MLNSTHCDSFTLGISVPWAGCRVYRERCWRKKFNQIFNYLTLTNNWTLVEKDRNKTDIYFSCALYKQWVSYTLSNTEWTKYLLIDVRLKLFNEIKWFSKSQRILYCNKSCKICFASVKATVLNSNIFYNSNLSLERNLFLNTSLHYIPNLFTQLKRSESFQFQPNILQSFLCNQYIKHSSFNPCFV